MGTLEIAHVLDYPDFIEIKMDAEIGAYQPDDFGQDPAVPFTAPGTDDAQAAE